MDRRKLAGVVRMRAFWIRYFMVLFQALVIVAYFLPWERVYSGAQYPRDGLLEWMYSGLTHDPSASRAFFIASLLTCFLAAITSLVLALFALAKQKEHTSALRVSSMFGSLAIAGPLLFLHRYLPWPFVSADVSHLWPLIGEMATGWYIALISGSVACVLSLILYHEACKTSEGGSATGRRASSRVHGTTFLSASFLIVVIGCVITVAGFFQTWNTCYSDNPWGLPYHWSNNGFEISPLMYLIPLAAMVSTALLIMSLFVSKTRGLVLSEASQNLLVVALALALFWGLSFGEYRFYAVDLPLIVAKLQLGWYLCVAGQLIMFVSVLLFHRFRSAASDDNGILRSKSTLRQPS